MAVAAIAIGACTSPLFVSIASATSGPIAYDSAYDEKIAYTSYPDYGVSGVGSDDTPDTLPGVPATGGIQLSAGESLMSARVHAGGLSTAAAIAITILGVAILGGTAYGINSVYGRNKEF